MMPCVFCLYTLLKVVGYYDVSVLSMSVMIKVWMGVGLWGELYPFFLYFWNCFNFAKPLSPPVGTDSMQQSRSYLFHVSMNSFSHSNDRIFIYVVLTFMLLFPNSFKFGTFTIESWRIQFPTLDPNSGWSRRRAIHR